MAGAYVFPFGKGLTRGRIDQGIDYGGSGHVFALGDAVVERVAPQNSSTGWPGAGGSGTGAMIVYKLTSGARAGQHVYLAENIDPVAGLKVGDTIRAGQHIATARGAYPYLETGWASDAGGTTLAAARGTRDTHPNHSNTPEGLDFAKFTDALGRGGQGTAAPDTTTGDTSAGPAFSSSSSSGPFLTSDRKSGALYALLWLGAILAGAGALIYGVSRATGVRNPLAELPGVPA